MSVRGRILALKLLEKQKRQPEFAEKLGIEIKIKSEDNKNFFKKLLTVVPRTTIRCSERRQLYAIYR